LNLSEITIISQEMLLGLLFSKKTKVVDLGEPLLTHTRLHPVLDAIPGIKSQINHAECFKWPSVNVTGGDGSISGGVWPNIGLLKFLGYFVGVEGKAQVERQAVLNKTFRLVQLPHVVSEVYIRSWGDAETATRLKKIAESIAAFCRNAKRRDSFTMKRAIENWEADLIWLRHTFYDGRFDGKFIWPKT
jgi:hypothetical protein